MNGQLHWMSGGTGFSISCARSRAVEHGRTTLNLFRGLLDGMNQLVREGVSAGESLSTLQAELFLAVFVAL